MSRPLGQGEQRPAAARAAGGSVGGWAGSPPAPHPPTPAALRPCRGPGSTCHAPPPRACAAPRWQRPGHGGGVDGWGGRGGERARLCVLEGAGGEGGRAGGREGKGAVGWQSTNAPWRTLLMSMGPNGSLCGSQGVHPCPRLTPPCSFLPAAPPHPKGGLDLEAGR